MMGNKHNPPESTFLHTYVHLVLSIYKVKFMFSPEKIISMTLVYWPWWYRFGRQKQESCKFKTSIRNMTLSKKHKHQPTITKKPQVQSLLPIIY